MADVQITCPKCSTTLTISEFADAGNLVCRSCGEPLKKPESPKQKSKAAAIKTASAETLQETSQTSEGQSLGGNWQVTQTAARIKRPKQKFHMTPGIWAWVIFIILGGIMAYLRYGGGFLGENTAMIYMYGPIVVATIHLMVVLKSFKDSVFQGVLCLLVPGYSLYYLFLVADDFILRGIAGGIFVGIGQESFKFFLDEAHIIIKMINDWIARGGD